MLNLRRVTSSGRFIPEIDGLRFLAIVSVVLFHFHGDISHHGAVRSPFETVDPLRMELLAKRGVYLFFAISGFILGTPFAKARIWHAKPVNLKSYLMRRVTRLEPPYLLSLLIYTAAVVRVGNITFHAALPHLFASIFYLHNFLFHNQGASPINGVIWSLEVEVQFYLLVPLLTYLFAVPGSKLRRCVLVIAVLLSSLLTLELRTFVFRIVYFLPFFLAGFVVCDLYLEYGTNWREQKTYLWDVVGLVFLPAIWLIGESAEHVLLPFVFMVFFIAAFRGRVLEKLLSVRWITDIGGMCYTIYLFHSLEIWTIGKVVKRFHVGHNFYAYFLLQAALTLPLVWLLCALFFVFVERPCMDPQWPTKLMNYLRGLRVAPAGAVTLQPSPEMGYLQKE